MRRVTDYNSEDHININLFMNDSRGRSCNLEWNWISSPTEKHLIALIKRRTMQLSKGIKKQLRVSEKEVILPSNTKYNKAKTVNFLPTIRLAQSVLKRKIPFVDKPLRI